MIVSTIKSDGSILYHPVTKYGKGVCDCGNVFIKKATNHECCSSRCLNKRYYVAKPVITKRCIKCNKEFKTKSESKSLCKSTCGKKVDYYSKLGIRTFKCKGCNKSFESERKRLFCSKDCNKKSIAESKKTPLLIKKCGCGQDFKQTQATQKYCSKECRCLNNDRNKAKTQRHKEYQRQYHKNKRKENYSVANIKCVHYPDRLKTNLLYKYNNGSFIITPLPYGVRENYNLSGMYRQYVSDLSIKNRPPLKCEECGVQFSVLSHQITKYCSSECGDRRLRRIHKSKRRARERRLPYQLIDPIDVFNRDGWLCNGCGEELSINDRGTNKLKAPELDHIKPLSKGGSHTYNNVQLLCKSCNIKKSNHYE